MATKKIKPKTEPKTEPPVVAPTAEPGTAPTENQAAGDINLKPEADNLQTEEKQAETDNTFECGNCGATFKERTAYCPKCGVELE